jgi:hypothetical protein
MFSKIAQIVGHCRLLLSERYRLSRSALARLISTLLIVAGVLALLIAIFAAAPLFAANAANGDRTSVSREILLQATNPRQSRAIVHPTKEAHSHAMYPLNVAQAITLPPER